MDDERVALGKPPEFLAQFAADVDPVLGRDFHEVDLARRFGHQLVHQGATQAEAGPLDRVLRRLVHISLGHDVSVLR